MLADQVIVKCVCVGCGETTECDERDANGPAPVYCPDCDDARAEALERRDRNSYDRACGYLD